MKSNPENDALWGMMGVALFCLIVSMPFLRLLGVL